MHLFLLQPPARLLSRYWTRTFFLAYPIFSHTANTFLSLSLPRHSPSIIINHHHTHHHRRRRRHPVILSDPVTQLLRSLSSSLWSVIDRGGRPIFFVC